MANLIEESQVYYDALETQTLDAVTDGAKKEKITSEEIIQVRNKAEHIVTSLKQNQVIHLGQKRRQMKIFGLNFSSPLMLYRTHTNSGPLSNRRPLFKNSNRRPLFI